MMSDNVMPMCCNTGWGGSGLGAGVGGFLGAAIGNGGLGGWGGGWNRGGFGYTAGLDNAILDSVNGVSNSVNNLNTANLQGQCQIQAGVDRNAAQIINAQNQGFAGLNTAIVQNGYESRLATAAAAQQQAQCCCDLKGLIRDEGCATRSLITQTQVDALRDQLCQVRSENSLLRMQADNAAQTAAIFARYPVTSTSTTPAA